MSQRFLQHAQGWVDNENLKKLSPEELERSEEKLTPYIPTITSEIEGIREYLDGIVRKNRKKLKGKVHPQSFLGKYPIGQCKEIRDSVQDIMQSNNRQPSLPGLQAIRRYNKTSLAVVKGIWGIQNENNFQNAIQVGGYCIDAALDTVDEPEPKVAVKRIEDCGIRNVEDFTDFADIAEKYWGEDLYPNIYVPQLAGIFPAICITESGKIKFEGGCASVLGRNILSRGEDIPIFQNALDFTLKSQYSHKRLPDKYVDKLGRIFNTLRFDGSPVIKSLCDFEEEGCPLMTEAALHQRVSDRVDGILDKHYDLAYFGLGKPLNEKGITA
ncbi:hypothetical protein LR010_03485 [Candidatus Gracilibacteria bacterium]|nr:hypothetical protein [Candidatus Gracilibacteria bacterium]